MSHEAFLPCFVCGKALLNTFTESDNQPSEGTEFRTYGHYGSTFWDSFDGEELVLNICDECLNKGKERLAQQKRFLPIKCSGLGGYGRHWVERPMVHYTGNRDDTVMKVGEEDLGVPFAGVEWAEDINELKKDLESEEKQNEKQH
jgi:hypothetical protein